MEAPLSSRKGYFLLVALLLVISILVELYWIDRLLPWLSELGGVQPMIIFLDIPLRLPVIHWIPVGILFVFFYLVFIARPAKVAGLTQKGWAILAGWWVLLLFIVAGGGLYYLLEDQLPKQVRNGIDSFGFRADLAVPFRDDIVHLHGGMIMLIALLIGGRFFFRRTAVPVAMPTTINVPEPAPQSIQLPPEPTPATLRPCVVTGILEPH